MGIHTSVFSLYFAHVLILFSFALTKCVTSQVCSETTVGLVLFLKTLSQVSFCFNWSLLEEIKNFPLYGFPDIFNYKILEVKCLAMW